MGRNMSITWWRTTLGLPRFQSVVRAEGNRGKILALLAGGSERQLAGDGSKSCYRHFAGPNSSRGAASPGPAR